MAIRLYGFKSRPEYKLKQALREFSRRAFYYLNFHPIYLRMFSLSKKIDFTSKYFLLLTLVSCSSKLQNV